MTTTEAPFDIDALFDDVEYRSAAIEEMEAEERIVTMRAVPYDHAGRIGENVEETFARGAFSRSSADPGRVKLWFGHSTAGGHIVGQAVDIDDREDGVWIRARVSQTARGDELLTLARDKVLDQASIEFAPIRKSMTIQRRGDTIHVRHHRGHLKGVALVPHGAYGREAMVTSVRDDAADEIEKARAAAIERLQSLDG